LTSLPALVLTLVVTLLAAVPAGAHSLLISSEPAANAALTTSPAYLVLRFNNRIEKRLSRVRLVDERGRAAAASVIEEEPAAAETLSARMPAIAPGAWRVEWQVFSTDGHVVSGAYGFRLAP
jgi:copper resistance protein C